MSLTKVDRVADRAAVENYGGFVLAVAATLSLACKTVTAKHALQAGVPVLPLLTWRMLLAVPVMAALACWYGRGREPLGARLHLRLALLAGVGIYLPALASFHSLAYISVGLERIVVYTYPCWVLLFGALTTGRRVGRRQLSLFACCWIGLVAAWYAEIGVADDTVGSISWGVGLAAFAALAWAWFLHLGGDAAQRVGGGRWMAWAVLYSAGWFLLHSLVVDATAAFTAPSPGLVGHALVLALLHTALPMILTGVLLQRIGAQRFAVLGACGPVGSILVAGPVLAEWPGPLQIAGIAMALLAGWSMVAGPGARASRPTAD